MNTFHGIIRRKTNNSSQRIQFRPCQVIPYDILILRGYLIPTHLLHILLFKNI